MKKPITEGRLRYQAMRCETAKCKRCKCHCGGAFHGTKHAEDWIAEEVLRDKVKAQQVPQQDDWVGYTGFEKYILDEARSMCDGAAPNNPD